jgi:ABC-type lipoprotein release transport system permease subunit
MIKQWLYYTRLALLDLSRLWQTVQSHVIVVAGICLPLLLLQGLKRGHVATLRESLLRSPTGRVVEIWHGQSGVLLRRSTLEQLGKQLRHVELLAPNTEHLATLTRRGPDGKTVTAPNATLRSTVPGDPMMRLFKADVLREGERRVILGEALAAKLGAGTGDTVTLHVKRSNGDEASTDLEVAAVLAGSGELDCAYLTADFHDRIEQCIRGFRVADLDWAATGESTPDEYHGYLLLCKPDDDLVTADLEDLGRIGLQVDPIKDEAVRTLYGILRPNQLHVYFVHSELSHKDSRERLHRELKDITDRTRADDAIIPWCPPLVGQVGGRPCRVVGCSVLKRTWLRSYLANAGDVFSYDDDELQVKLPAGGAAGELRLTVNGDGRSCEVPVRTAATGRPDTPALAAGLTAGIWGGGPGPGGPIRQAADTGRWLASVPPAATPDDLPTAVVPVNCLAHLHRVLGQTAQFDPHLKRFVALPEELSYAKAYVYAETIDDVPDVVAQVAALNYLYDSQSGRIEEIHKQDASLGFIVVVVGVGVWLFGVFTVYNVLHESTARKRGMIGILRVMGVPREGVFYLILTRACLLGLIAGAVTIALGALAPWPLEHLPPRLKEPTPLAVTLLVGAGGLFLWRVITWRLRVAPSTPARTTGRRGWGATLTRGGLVLVADLGLVAAIAAATSCLFAWLTHFESVQVITRPGDSLLILASAIACCVVGALLPAWESSRLDPFDAIVEGKFR